MFKDLLKNPLALLIAVLGHLLVIALVVVGLDLGTSDSGTAGDAVQPIKAITVESSEVDAAVKQLEQARRKQELEQQARETEARKLKEAEQAKLDAVREQLQAQEQAQQQQEAALAKLREEQREIEDQRQQEQQRLEELAAKQQQEAERLAALQEQRQQEEQERKQREAEAREREAAEQQRQEQERLAKLEAERQQQREQEAMRQLEQEEAARQAEEQAARQRALEAELQASLRAEEEVRLSGLRSQYHEAIRRKVASNWIRPASIATAEISCDVLVNQIPSGDITNVRVLHCDGGAAFQRSVEVAVLKASPLPSPPDPALFEREIEFTFRPEN